MSNNHCFWLPSWWLQLPPTDGPTGASFLSWRRCKMPHCLNFLWLTPARPRLWVLGSWLWSGWLLCRSHDWNSFGWSSILHVVLQEGSAWPSATWLLNWLQDRCVRTRHTLHQQLLLSILDFNCDGHSLVLVAVFGVSTFQVFPANWQQYSALLGGPKGTRKLAKSSFGQQLGSKQV